MRTAGRFLPEKLPLLRGRAWWAFLAVWAATVALAVIGGALYLRDDMRLTPSGDYQLGFMEKSSFNTGNLADRGLVDHVLSRQARANGLRPGDRILSLNGQPLGQESRPIGALWERLGEPVRVDLLTLSPDGRRATRRLTASMAHADEGIGDSGLGYRSWRKLRTAAMMVDELVAPLALGMLLLMWRARDRLAPWVSLAFVLSAATSGPAARSSVLQMLIPWAGWGAINLASGLAIAMALTLFPDGRFRPRWCWLVLLLSLLLAVVASFVPLSLAQQDLLGGVSLIPAVAAVWARYRLLPPGTARQQIRWALFGFALSLFAYFVGVLALRVQLSDQISPATFVRLDLVAVLLFDFYGLLLFAAMTLGLMRYRLYDADATISRSVGYGAITLSLLGVFAGTEKVIEVLGERYLGDSLGALANGLGAAVAAAMIVPIHHRVTHWAEKRFRSGLVQLRLGLPLLVGDLRETATPAALADAMLLRVERGVRARHGAVVVAGDVLDARDVEPASVETWLARGTAPTQGLHQLHCDRRDPLFPVRVPLQADGVGLVGWLLLGPRPDGSFYGREERAALRDISDPVARALAVAIERQRRERERRAAEAARQEREEGLHRRLEALRRFVHEHFGFDADAAAPSFPQHLGA